MSRTATSDAALLEPLPRPKPRRRWLKALLLLVVFATGFAIGVAATLTGIQKRERARQDPAVAAAEDTKNLRKVLQLTDRQAEEVESLFRARHAAIGKSLRFEIGQLEHEVADVLDEPQKAQWHEIMSRLRSEWEWKDPNSEPGSRGEERS